MPSIAANSACLMMLAAGNVLRAGPDVFNDSRSAQGWCRTTIVPVVLVTGHATGWPDRGPSGASTSGTEHVAIGYGSCRS
jgi:hypothetical protein